MIFIIKNNSGGNIKKIILSGGFINLTHNNLKNKDSIQLIANLDIHKHKEGVFLISAIKEQQDTLRIKEPCCYFSKFLGKTYYSKFIHVNILPNKIEVVEKEK